MEENKRIFEEGRRYLVGGVNSPVRAMKPYPFIVREGHGAEVKDLEGQSYIDYCLAYGPLILGHSNPEIVEAVKAQLDKGTLYGCPTEVEIEFAKAIVEHVPNIERIRTVNTGTEATMSAIRLARGVTGKKRVIKFEGAFHGAHDTLLVKAGSGALTHGVPTSKGIPEEIALLTTVIPFNDLETLAEALKKKDVAALIAEPIIGNAGCIMPRDGFWKEAAKIVHENEAILIFDEIITGFRFRMDGAQGQFGIDADIVTLGKIIGGGFPIGVFGASSELMSNITPEGGVYNAGTFNGNPVSVTAGLKTIEVLARGKVHVHIDGLGKRMRKGLEDMVQDKGRDYKVYGIGGMHQVYFCENEVTDLDSAKKTDTEMFLRYQRELLGSGVFLPPSVYECNFISSAHTEEHIDRSLEAMSDAFGKAIKG